MLYSNSLKPTTSDPGPTALGFSPITLSSIVYSLKRLLFEPKLFWTFATLVIVADAILTQLIIRFVPCTNDAVTHQVVSH